jgi:hypothetical protein
LAYLGSEYIATTDGQILSLSTGDLSLEMPESGLYERTRSDPSTGFLTLSDDGAKVLAKR